MCPSGTFTSGECCRGTAASCDMRFEDWRPSSYHATYLASLARSELLKGSASLFSTGNDLQRIIDSANSILENRFAVDPGFRYVDTSMSPDFGLLVPQGNESKPSSRPHLSRRSPPSRHRWIPSPRIFAS